MRIDFALSDSPNPRRAVQQSVRRCRWLLCGVLTATWLTGGAGDLWGQADSAAAKATGLDKPKIKSKTMDRYRAKLEVKDDAEWNVIQKRIEGVFWAER